MHQFQEKQDIGQAVHRYNRYFADNYLFVDDDKVIDVLSKNDIFISKYIDRFNGS